MGEIIDDLIVLGRAGPELISDGRHTICLGGWSPTRGFIRIYPTHMYSEAQRWNVIQLPVENRDDYRNESWKIEGSKDEWDNLHEKINRTDQLTRDEQIKLIENLPKTCPSKLNKQEESLGIVKPNEITDAYLEKVNDREEIQQDLQGHDLKSKNSYKHKLYIRYTCSGCDAKQGYHEQHVMEWGIYKWWDKNPDQAEQIIDNLRLFDDEWNKHFFVGNLKNHPTSYVIISVIRFKKSPESVAAEEHHSLNNF